MRLIWCSTAERAIHGSSRPGPEVPAAWWQRLLGIKPKRGVEHSLESVDLEEALRSLSLFLEQPGSYAIETQGGMRIDILARRGAKHVTLDCWFYDGDDEIDTANLGVEDVPELIRSIYAATRDADVVRSIRTLEAKRK